MIDLEKYIDKISDLALNHGLRNKGDDKTSRIIARFQTMLALRQASVQQKSTILHFLYEMGLVSGNKPIIKAQGFDFSWADFSESEFRFMNLDGANLSNCDFSKATLCKTSFRDANFTEASLENAHLTDSILCGANLEECNLMGVLPYYINLKCVDITDAIMPDNERLLWQSEVKTSN